MSKLEIEEIFIESDDFETSDMLNDNLITMKKEEKKMPNIYINVFLLLINIVFIIFQFSCLITYSINCNAYMNTESIEVNILNSTKKKIDYSTMLYEINFRYNYTNFKKYYSCDLYSYMNSNKCLKKYDELKIGEYVSIYYGYGLYIFNNPNRCPAMILSYLPFLIILISIIVHIIIFLKGLKINCKLFKYTKKLILLEMISLLILVSLIKLINIFL
jgi:hypothetical protein